MSGSPHEQILRDAAVSLRETIQKLNDVQGNESKMVFQLISNASELVTQMDTVCNLLSRPNSTDHISLEPLAQLSLESEDDDEHTVPVFVPTSVHFSATPAVQFISEDQGDAMTLEEFQTYKLVLTQGAVFQKFKYNKSHERVLWVDQQLEYLFWGTSRDIKTAKGSVAIRSIADVVTSSEDCKSTCKPFLAAFESNPDCCLSVVTPSRTVDLVAEDHQTRDDWAAALTNIVFANPAHLESLAQQGYWDGNQLDVTTEEQPQLVFVAAE